MNMKDLRDYSLNPVEDASPLFPPHHIITDLTQESLLHVIRRDPRQFDHTISRWTLAAIQQSCHWLNLGSLSGVWRLLKRFKIHYKGARDYIHSPDPDYLSKLATIRFHIRQAGQKADELALLFLDEFSYYRQPTLARAYEAAGQGCSLARLSQRSNCQFRVVATLDVFSGRVVYRQRSKITVSALVRFYEQLCEAYHGIQLYIVQDNWPIHFHPDVLAALQPQVFQYPLPNPASWPKEASKNARRLNLPIKLLQLPTYASWNNPIEKLWRWLKQDILHLHRHADEWDQLKELIAQFLDQFANGSEQLRRYVGLMKPDGIYGAALAAAGILPP